MKDKGVYRKPPATASLLISNNHYPSKKSDNWPLLNAAQVSLQFSVSSVTRDIALLATSWDASIDSGLESTRCFSAVQCYSRRLSIARGCYGVVVSWLYRCYTEL